MGRISAYEFSALTEEEQLEGLRRLGEHALAQFGVRPDKISSLVHAENTTFCVDTGEGRFNLRISRPGYQSSSNIRSEIQFLSALREADFLVPAPYQERLVTASDDGVPEARDCVLLRWMDGEFSARPTYTPPLAALVGRKMAELHEFATQWTPPKGFDRQSQTVPERPEEEGEPLESMGSRADRDLVWEVLSEFRELCDQLPCDKDWHGLIHSDLHGGNVLFEGGVVKVIDFDDTGWCFLVSDFSAALAASLSSEQYPDIRSEMLRAYAEVRPLPPQTEILLDKFIQGRLARVAAWVLSRSDNPTFREGGHKWVSAFCDQIRKLRAD